MNQLALLFHFNQHLNEMASLASQVCYRGLLRTLRANPAIKANLHLSGTLITALKWLDPEPLELIREGLADGQFELAGSTFAQNVPYASDDWDNARQIELHKQMIEGTFKVTPTMFWVSERCWRQSLVPVIAGSGYRTITIEDHILEKSGGKTHQVYFTREGAHTLHIVRDDEKLKHYFNFAAWFGETEPFHKYLDGLVSSQTPAPDGNVNTFCYAEDAEAMGLWGYYQGVIPTQTWDRLDTFLKTLSARPDVKPILFREIPDPVEEITPLADGAAAWMDASLAKEGLPYHEDGYQAWFDFNTRAPRLEKYRRFYADIRQQLQKTSTSAEHPNAKALYELGLHSYLTHQYEFGCIGIGNDTYRGWLGANAARVLASSVALADLTASGADAIQFTTVDELSQDGVMEWLHVKEDELIITTPIGGRLLYWLNLQRGQMLIGNSSAVVPGKYEGHAYPPLPLSRPTFWLPQGEPYQAFEQPEHPPTRLAKFLPDWIWADHPEPVALAVRDMQIPGERTTLPAQQGALCDEIWLDGKPVFTRQDRMEVEGSREAVRFFKWLGTKVEFRKKYTLERDTVTIVYTFTNHGKRTRKVRMRTTSELALDYAAVLRHGRAALDFLPDRAGVVNPLTGETLSVTVSPLSPEVVRSSAMLGLNIGLGFEFSLAPNKPVKFSINLMRE